jgi:hypothetical protein
MHNNSVCRPCQEKCCIASIDFLEQADRRAISIHKRRSSKYLHLLQNENQGPVQPGFFVHGNI